ncbi:hypothetical protein CYL16_06885 [Mycobacterium sp. EPG1]|nr:hypothetical protein CYL16_06885 [Mycobacterium sp. EPG1]
MDSAREYYEGLGWTVTDVSARRCFDLICKRADEEVLYVEVKGTTQAPAGIFLTANEVAHALNNAGKVALYILSEIVTERGSDGSVIAKGGTKAVLDPGVLETGRLTAKQYTYSLDGIV